MGVVCESEPTDRWKDTESGRRPVGLEGAEHGNLSKKLPSAGLGLQKPGEKGERAWRQTCPSGILAGRESGAKAETGAKFSTHTHRFNF